MSPGPATASSKSFAWRVSNTAPDRARVECRGHLISETSADFKREIKALVAGTKHVAIDFTQVAHMDSAGLGAMVGIYVSARAAGCDLRLMNFNACIRELLGITHLLDAFEQCGEGMIRMP